MSKSKETMAKKQQDDLAATLQNLPWPLPFPFPSITPFNPYSSLSIPPPPIPSSAVNNFSPYSLPSLISNNSGTTSTASSTNPWSNNLSTSNATGDYNDYAKQLGFLLNALNEQQQQQQQQPSQVDSSKSSTNTTNKSNKSKASSTTTTTNTNSKSSSDSHLNKNGTSSSSSSSSNHRNKSSSGKSNPNTSSSTMKPSTNTNESSTGSSSSSTANPMLDPLSLASTFPYFLPPFLTPSGTTNPFSNLSSSLLNPTASLYPFLAADWFNPTMKSTPDSKETLPASTSRSQSNTDDSSISKSKKRSKSNPNSTEETNSHLSNSQLHQTALTNPSLLHSALNKSGLTANDLGHSYSPLKSNLFDSMTENRTLNATTNNSNNGHTFPDHRLNSTQQSSSTDDDESDPNAKRRKTEEVNETLVRIPLNTGWKRVTIIRAITRTGVRGDVAYYAPCGRKLRSFQEIDRYLAKKKMTNLDRSNFTFSSKVHIGHFHQPKEGPDGKVIFQEFTEKEIVDRILKMNPKFRQIPSDLSSEAPTKTPTPTDLMSTTTFDENRSSMDLTGRTTETKKKRDGTSSRSMNAETPKTSDHLNVVNAYPHHEFLKAMIEQQKFLQQQEIEQQQEQERKRQEMAYLKQLELKKRQEEKLMLIEQRKAEKNAEREKKIQEKCTEMALAREMKRIAEDMQLRDLKPLPSLTLVDHSRISADAFANALMIVEFLQNFKEILQLADHLIPTLNSLSQMNLRDINSLCQSLLRLALEDPGIPNPKKALTHLGQKLSEIDITEHTFSEILRIYIRERNGFDEKISQTLSDTSFQSLSLDEKIEILAFLCNDLSTSKRVVDETDRHLDELIALKHEKLEMEKRLRRLKLEKVNQTSGKKVFPFSREKDLNSSDNESPDESDSETMQVDPNPSINADPMTTASAEDADLDSIEDLDQRLSLVTKKYILFKRRVISKQCRARALHLGQDRYRRRYWYFTHIPGIYVEGLRTGDVSSDDLKEMIDQVTKQRLDKKSDGTTNETNNSSRPTARKRQQTKTNPSSSVVPPTKIKIEQQEEEPIVPSIPVGDDPATMDLSSFCVTNETHVESEMNQEEKSVVAVDDPIKVEVKDETELLNIADENQPLDLTCSKSKRRASNDDQPVQRSQVACLLPASIHDNGERMELTATVSLLSNIKQENILNLTASTSTSIKEDPSINQFQQIEQTIRERFQYPQPQPIPEDVQSGWWTIQTGDELRSLIKSLTRRGQRERYLCRMLQRYFDVLTHSMTIKSESETVDEEQQASSSNDFLEHNSSQFDDRHEMDILNEIYNLSERIISSNFQSRSYDVNHGRTRLTYSDIQAKGLEILDEAKHLLLDLERHIERRYLKPPFVRKSELNGASLARIHQNNANHSSSENVDDENSNSTQHDEVPQQLERWRRTVNECRTPAQLALCLTQLDRCIAWERSIMRVFCEICNSDDDEEKLLLCDGCDHGSHTYCFRPPMSFIPPNDWFCYVCIGKAQGETLCFVCGSKGDQTLNRCEQCGKSFHEECLKNAKQQRGKWLCVLCAANDPNSSKANTTKQNNVRQTARSSYSRQSSISSSSTSTPANGDSTPSSRSRTNQTRKAKPTNLETAPVPESQSNSSDDDDTTSSTVTEPAETNSPKKKSTRSTKVSKDIKACRMILNELLKSEASWPFQTPVDPKEHPEYYECVKEPMDFSIMKKKMRSNQYKKRDEFSHDVELILNNCEYYNEDDSPVGQAGHNLRKVFHTQWTKQFG